jgi:hypothetical protein
MLVLLDGDRGLLVPNPSAELLDLAIRRKFFGVLNLSEFRWA